MTLIHWNRDTFFRKVIVGALCAGLTLGGTLWAQPMTPGAGGQRSGEQRSDDQQKSTQQQKSAQQQTGAQQQQSTQQQKSAQQQKSTQQPKNTQQQQTNQQRNTQKTEARKGGGSYPTPGKISNKMPGAYDTVRFGSNSYFVYQGIFYARDPKGYKVVRPPRGVVVRRLPTGFETLVVAGLTYFVFAGIYYSQTATGYAVVDAPVSTGTTATTAVVAQTGNLLAVDVALLNVRSGPGTGNSVVSQVRSGDTLTVQGTSGEWYYVMLPDGSYGWVMARYTRQLYSGAQG